MKKLKAALQRVSDRLTGRKADLAKSRRRHKVWREHYEKQERKAARLKSNGHLRRAEAVERRAKRSHAKALYWKERVRRDDKAIHKLEAIEGRLEKEVNEWLKTHGAQLIGHNKIRGGDYEERSFLAQSTAMINYRNGTATAGSAYYSMEGGARDYSHILYHYPSGRVYDCSTYADGTKFVTGDPSPSGPHGFTLGGWTGTELENCKRISESDLKIGDLVVYIRFHGDTAGHHVEVVYNVEKRQTSGHGDAAINIGCNGSWDLFGDGLYVFLRPPRDHKEHLIHAHHEHALAA